jgi:uncharacterized repeat protein (TIGR01451 family)
LTKKNVLILFFGTLFFGIAQAAPIQRTITIDGDVSDWTSPTDITTNAGQFSTDGDGRSCPSTDLDTGSPCSALTPGGRDLQRFAYTWDSSNVYIYVTRWGTTNNVTDWWFYLDTDNDGFMEDGEAVFRVSWQGNNQNTDRTLYVYDAVNNATGDPLVNPTGDGYTMPGTITGGTPLVSATGGTADQFAMESWLAWGDLGFTGPTSIGFHIASSNGANIPNSVIDNMDGPVGGGFSFPDLSVAKVVSADPVFSGHTFTYTVSITNNGDADATNVAITDQLPAEVTYVSYAASQGAFNSGTGVWTVGDIPYTQPTLTTVTLTLTVTANIVASDTTATNTANNLVLDQADPDTSNNSASVDVLIRPAPNLSVVKSRSTATVKPSEIITYTLEVTNNGFGVAPNTVIDDVLSPYVAMGMDVIAGLTLGYDDGVPCGTASGLSLGAVVFADDRPPTYGYAGAGTGYDPLVTAWQVPMTGSMAVGSCFTLTYQVQVK